MRTTGHKSPANRLRINWRFRRAWQINCQRSRQMYTITRVYRRRFPAGSANSAFRLNILIYTQIIRRAVYGWDYANIIDFPTGFDDEKKKKTKNYRKHRPGTETSEINRGDLRRRRPRGPYPPRAFLFCFRTYTGACIQL